MKDCQYLSLEKKKFGQGVTNFKDIEGIPSNVNRMGTENYKLADFYGNTEQSVFSYQPSNLRANREKSYTNNRRDELSKTKNNEALVEYYVTRWEYSLDGPIRKVL